MTRPAQILLVDDEVAIQRAIAPLLRSRGYAVTLAATGAEAVDAFERERPDMVILDLGLPDIDGTEVCRLLRERADVPILVLSARGAEKDKVTALDHGADDYITKPFGPEELMARVRASLRRSLGRDTPLHGQLTRGDLTIDFDRRRVSLSGHGSASDAERVRVADAARQPRRPRAHASVDFEEHLGHRTAPASRSTCAS